MIKLSITPAWIFRSEQGELFDPILFGLLETIRESGKLTVAAQSCGISYRHAWNLLNRSGAFFGLPLVDMRKGQGTRLSPLGEKLLWSEQQVKARLGPQIDSMASDLNDQIQQLLAGAHPVLRIHASHGYAIALLPDFSEQVEVNLQYRNPHDALNALARRDCDVASFHFPTDPGRARKVMEYYHTQLDFAELTVIRFVTRKQGLMYRPDSHFRVEALNDLVKPGLRFIGRNQNSGTRILFNMLLQEQGISAGDISGSEQEEFTHTAVAAYVAAGMADVGFGIEAAARQFGLAFVPLSMEHYLLICRKEEVERANMNNLLSLMRSGPFIGRVMALPGYAPDHCGELSTFAELLENQNSEANQR